MKDRRTLPGRRAPVFLRIEFSLARSSEVLKLLFFSHSETFSSDKQWAPQKINTRAIPLNMKRCIDLFLSWDL